MLAGVPVRVKREPVPRYNFFFFLSWAWGERRIPGILGGGLSFSYSLTLFLTLSLRPSHAHASSLFRSLSFFGKIKREPKNRNETKDSCICKSMYTCIMNVLVPPGSLDTLSLALF